jgi:zinc finger FYVE domain-containing protein 26
MCHFLGSKGRDSESPASNAPDSPEILPSSEIQLPLKLPARQLDHHVSTICRQLEAAKFLQQCESEGRSVVGVATDLNSNLETGTVPPIPTLFGNSTERAHLSALVILCGKNVEEGFGITFRLATSLVK